MDKTLRQYLQSQGWNHQGELTILKVMICYLNRNYGAGVWGIDLLQYQLVWRFFTLLIVSVTFGVVDFFMIGVRTRRWFIVEREGESPSPPR